MLQAGASPVNDQWRTADKVTGYGMEDVREDRQAKLTRADQVLAFFEALDELANLVCVRTMELYQFLPIVRDIDPEWEVPGSLFCSKLKDAAPYYPPGATLPRMHVAYAMDAKTVCVCDGPEAARLDRLDREKAKRAAKAEARRVARNAERRRRRAAAKAVSVEPPAIADRMKPSLNGHARTNGTH